MPFSFEAADNIPCTTFYGVATGTHSAGKSTLVNSFSDPEFERQFDLEHDDPYNLIPKIGGSVLLHEGMLVPIITAEEASTFYVRKTGRAEHVTTDYTFEHQIQMEHTALAITMDALEAALRIAALLQPDASERQAIILSDRSQLDGWVYSSLRTPDANQEMINQTAVNQATVGFSSGTVPGIKTPQRKWARDFMNNYCDFVVVPDHTEVEFEDNGMRQADLKFRDDVANTVMNYYTSILGPEKITLLQGNETQRHDKVREVLHIVLDSNSKDYIAL